MSLSGIKQWLIKACKITVMEPNVYKFEILRIKLAIPAKFVAWNVMFVTVHFQMSQCIATGRLELFAVGL